MEKNFEGKELCNGVRKKKTKVFQEDLPTHTPLISFFRHKNEDHYLEVRNLEANFGEGRWQNLPLDFYFTSNSCTVLIMIPHWTCLNNLIPLSECFHAVNIPWNNNFAVWRKCSVFFFFFEQKQKYFSGVNKKLYSLVKKKI